MKRRLAWFGLGFAGAEWVAADMPPLALVPAAALLVCLLVVFRRRPASLPLLGAMAGICFFALYGVFGVAPVQALAGQTHTCTVVVETDAETSPRRRTRQHPQPAQRRRRIPDVGRLPRGTHLPLRHHRLSPVGRNPQNRTGRRGRRGMDLLR